MGGLVWQVARFGRNLHRGIPRAAGVYVLAEVIRFAGLPLLVRPIYAGRTGDLRRRFQDHADAREPNLLLNGRKGLEFWFALAEITAVAAHERELIAALQPPANRRGKSKTAVRRAPHAP